MNWIPEDSWIVLIGALCAVACALPGCFLVLRQMSMMGDAISHAVLPGLAIAFIVTGARASFTMFIGAAFVGVLTAVFTHWISAWGKVDRGASMGIVFTTLFALGLLLIVRAADHVDLDPGCVLYGAIEMAPFDVGTVFSWGGQTIAVPRSAMILGIVLLLNAGIIFALFKELRLSAFDPELATTLGINAQLMHYLLMTMVAVTTVAAFEAVGSIIVIAMLIVPAATALLLTQRLDRMLWISAVIGILSAVFGHLSAILLPLWLGTGSPNTSGMMAMSAGGFFILAWILAPDRGLVAKRWRRMEAVED